jgi:hypothetical protein
LPAEGPLHGYLRTSFGLSDRQFAQLVKNTLLAAATLRMQCQAGVIQFDLDPEAFIVTGQGDAADSRLRATLRCEVFSALCCA